MDNSKLYKFVFEEDTIKILRGYIIEETDFLYRVKTQLDDKEFILGKRGIIKIVELNDYG